ncbi:putative Ig domain-containing protein [Rudanella lutea]|uniref:putative Ig domain-containing protein n=1 Tax=Rudanella lutea TaxID=451374 RepID=UPI000382810D|nr:putative Ig domain-containing protein [Rudanella lutea]
MAKAQITGGVEVLGIGVPIGTTSSTVTQNFDALDNGITVSAAGLLGNVQGTYTNRTLVLASTGAPSLVGAVPTGGAYSFGTNSDRALGSNANLLNSAVGLVPIRYGILFQNSTGAPVSSLQVTYTGEQWYQDGDGAAQSLTAAYARFDEGTFSTIGGLLTGVLNLLNDLPIVSTIPYTQVPGLTFTSLQNGSTIGELDGNAAANRTTLTSTITFGTPLAPGEYVLLRWTDLNDGENLLVNVIDTDHSLAIDDLRVVANIVNNNPVANQGAITNPQTATVGVAFSTTTAGAFSDPDNQTLTYSATGLPASFSINPTTGLITGTAATTVGSPFSVSVIATDPFGGSASVGFTLNVVNPPNQPPVLVGGGIPSPQSATVGIGFSTTTAGAFSDPDGGTLTYSAAGLPNGLSINPTTGVISGTPTVSGTFNVTVTANDGQGGSVNSPFQLNVAPANQPPVLVGGGIPSPQSATVGIGFSTTTAGAFSDPDGGTLTYTAAGLPNGLSINPTTGVISGSPTVSGTFNVTVTANDGQGGSVSSPFQLNVAPANQPPVLVGGGIPSPQSATVGIGFSTTTAGAFSDPDGGTLTYAAAGLPNGLSINPTTGVISGTPTVSGTFNVTVTANDGQGGSVSSPFQLNVAPANQPPVLVGGGIPSPQSATVGIGFSTTTAGAFSDPDGGTLTYAAAGLPNGLSINPTTGVISGTPTVSGTFNVTVTANDGQGGSVSSPFQLNVAPANQPPVLVGGGIPSPQSATVGIGFSTTTAGAFSDPDGGTLTYTAAGLPNGLSINPTTGVISGTPTVSGTFNVTVTANDGQGGSVSSPFQLNVAPNGAPSVTSPGDQSLTLNTPASFTIVATDPEGGTLTYAATGLPGGLNINPTTGVVTGTPSQTGVFPVSVTVTDPQGTTGTVSFNVTVNPQVTPNQPPVLVGLGIASPQSGTVGVPFTSTVSGAFSDPNGNPLTFTAMGLPAGLAISSGGVISGTPTVSGSFNVTVTANDGQGGTVSDDFVLNVSPAAGNQPPTLVGLGIASPQSGTVGIPFTSTVSGAFSDPDGGTLTFTAMGLPAGLSISSGGVISGTPTVSGSFNVTVTANDGQGGTVSDDFVLNVSPAAGNQPPTLVGLGIASPQSGTVGIPFTSTVSGAFSDPNGNPLTFTAMGLPAGLSISPSGVISGTPTVSGSFNVTVTANDGQGGTVSDDFVLNIAPSGAPVVTSPGDQSLTLNTPASFTIVATDPEGGALTYAASGLPAGLSINPNTGVVSGTPSQTGVFPVTVVVTDPVGTTSSVSFNVTVNQPVTPNMPPMLSGTPLASPQSATVGVGFSTNTAQAFVEPEMQPLTYSVTGLPMGININPSTGVISGNPSMSGTFGVTVIATDPQGASVSAGFTLNVSPAAPVSTTPLAVTVLSYNCVTGAIVFGRLGGDPNRQVEYMAIGVKGYSTDPSGIIEAAVRNDPNNTSITVMARYVGDPASQVIFVFNFRAFCSTGQPTNQSPVYNGGLANQVGTVGVPFTYTFPSNAFMDPEGQTLTYSAAGLPAGLSINGTTISGTPSVSGTFGVVITAQDPQGATATGNFQIQISPANSGTGVTGPLAATVLSYNCTTGAIVFGRVGGDPNRQVEYMAIGVKGYSTDPSGIIEAAVRADANNTSITVMARYVGDPASQVVFVFNFRAFCSGGQPTNQSPVNNGGLTNQVGTVGVPFTYTFPANTFSDPEGQTLTYSAAGLPAGLSINGTTISGTPSQSGTFGVVITARDPQGATATGSFQILINPAGGGSGAPIVNGTIPNQTATVGIPFGYTIPANTFTDPQGQSLTLTASGMPRGLLFNNGVFSGVPTQQGIFQITVTARDPDGNTASTTFTLTVNPSDQCGSDPTTIGQPLQLLEPTYNCQTGTIKFNVRGGNGTVIEFAAIGITPFQQNCFETMDTEVAQDVRNDKPNVEPFTILARQNGTTVSYSWDARAYCRPGGAGNPGSARMSVLEPMGNLNVTVFGNPTSADAVEFEVTGAEGKPLMLRLSDAQGKPMGEQRIEKAGAANRFVMPLGKSGGLYLLQVSTPNQVQTVKVVRQ